VDAMSLYTGEYPGVDRVPVVPPHVFPPQVEDALRELRGAYARKDHPAISDTDREVLRLARGLDEEQRTAIEALTTKLFIDAHAAWPSKKATVGVFPEPISETVLSTVSASAARTIPLPLPTPHALPVVQDTTPVVQDGPQAVVRYAFTHLAAAALFHHGIPLGWRPGSAQIGTPREQTWQTFTRTLQAPPVVRDWRDFYCPGGTNTERDARNCAKAVRGAVALCSLRDNLRTGSSFISTQLLGLDIDHGGNVDHALEVFDGLKKIIVSTYNSDANNGSGGERCRVFFPLRDLCSDRTLVQRGHDGLRARLVRQGHYQEGDLDAAGSDPERLFYLPVVPPGVTFRCEVTDGEDLDLARLAHGMPVRAVPSQRVTTPLIEDRITSRDASAALDIHSEAVRHAIQVCQDAAALGEGRRIAARSQAWILAHLCPPLHVNDIMRVIDICTPAGREHDFTALVLSALASAGRVP